MPSTSVTKFILNSIKPFRWWVAGQVLVAIIWAFELSLSPYLLKIMVDRMPGLPLDEAYSALLIPAILYMVLALVNSVSNRFYDFYLA